MRVLIDTNVYISALLFGGVPRAAIEAAEDNGETVSFSYIRQELAAVLSSPKFGWTAEHIGAACDALFAHTRMIEPQRIVRIARDHKDDPILACAVAANADAILTGDKDLLVLHPYKGMCILTPREFLETLR